jgi:hypothetical protein
MTRVTLQTLATAPEESKLIWKMPGVLQDLFPTYYWRCLIAAGAANIYNSWRYK